MSLPAEDVAFLDEYAGVRGVRTRSAAIHDAVRLLRASELAMAYELAWDEWAASDDAEVWDDTVADGLT